MAVKLRLIGEADEIGRLLDALDGVVEVAWDGRTYPVRSGFGVRVYVEARPRARRRASAERVGRPELPGARD